MAGIPWPSDVDRSTASSTDGRDAACLHPLVQRTAPSLVVSASPTGA